MSFFDRVIVYVLLGIISGNVTVSLNRLRDTAWDVYHTRNEVQRMKQDIKDMKDALNAVIQVPQEDK